MEEEEEEEDGKEGTQVKDWAHCPAQVPALKPPSTLKDTANCHSNKQPHLHNEAQKGRFSSSIFEKLYLLFYLA